MMMIMMIIKLMIMLITMFNMIMNDVGVLKWSWWRDKVKRWLLKRLHPNSVFFFAYDLTFISRIST